MKGDSTVAIQITTINPATEAINTYEMMTKEQISEKTKKAQNTHLDWRQDIQKRADHIHDFAEEQYLRPASGRIYSITHRSIVFWNF